MIGKLKDAARAGDLAVVNDLLDRGVDPDGAGRTAGQTPLGCAAARGHAEVIRALIRHGADPNLKDRWDAAPLCYADTPEIAVLLLALGAEWQPAVPEHWLGSRVDLAEVRVRELVDAQSAAYWQAFEVWIEPGDELRSFRSPPPSWENMMGRAGVAIVRDGVPIRAYVTVKN